MNQIILLIIFSILLVPGLLFIFLPVLPSIPYMFIIALVFNWVATGTPFSFSEIAILAFLAILSIAIDYLSGILGAKWGGASKKGLLFGFFGILLGTIIIPPFGGILGLFAGVLIAEFIKNNDHNKAMKAATGSLIGSISGMLINVLIGLMFITLFIIFAT